MITHAFTDRFGVKEGSVGTLSALFVFPLCTKAINTWQKLVWIPDTFCFFHYISSITTRTLSFFIPSVTEIAYRSTNIFFVEVPPFWTLNAFVILPFSTSSLFWLEQINLDALAISYIPALIAFLTYSFCCVEHFALGFNLAANSVLIKIESFRTLYANSIFILSAPKVVIYESQKVIVFYEILGKGQDGGEGKKKEKRQSKTSFEVHFNN